MQISYVVRREKTESIRKGKVTWEHLHLLCTRLFYRRSRLRSDPRESDLRDVHRFRRIPGCDRQGYDALFLLLGVRCRSQR